MSNPAKSFGILAEVSPEERERIFALPFGQFTKAIRKLKRKIYMREYGKRYRAYRKALKEQG